MSNCLLYNIVSPKKMLEFFVRLFVWQPDSGRVLILKYEKGTVKLNRSADVVMGSADRFSSTLPFAKNNLHN